MIGTVARIQDVKNHRGLVEAFARLRELNLHPETELEYAVEAPASGTPRPFTCSIRANHVSTKPRQEWKSELVLEGERGTVTATTPERLPYMRSVVPVRTVIESAGTVSP